jgi:hypothetical protein
MTDSRNSINLDDLLDFGVSNRISGNRDSSEMMAIFSNLGDFGANR